MFLFGRKQIRIKEVEESSLRTPRERLKYKSSQKFTELVFSGIKLYIAIARSILSKDLTNLDLLIEAASCWFRYQLFINSSKIVLTLNKDYVELLRDFSLTTRIGELAQGLSYLFVQEKLNYPIIVDFGGFLNFKCSGMSYQRKAPDYIIQKENNYDIGLLESKGHYASRNNSTKGKLLKALKQCDEGKQIIEKCLSNYNVKKALGICLKLYNDQDNNESELQFVDPDLSNRNKDFNLELIRYHYASWFLLMQNLQVYEKLMKGELLTEKDIESGTKANILGYSFYTFDITPFRYPLLFYPYFPAIYRLFDSYGIRSEVINVLMGKKEVLSLNIEKDMKEDKFQYEYFHDGTILISKYNIT